MGTANKRFERANALQLRELGRVFSWYSPLMDSQGRIHTLPDPAMAEQMQQFRQQLESLGVEADELESIPDKQVKRVRKMNRKARRRWYAKQRKKMRGRTS